MKYMLFVCVDENAETDTSSAAEIPADAENWVEEMTRRGVRVDGNALAPTSAASTVRVRSGETLVSDGPFAESKEQIAGFDILECSDLDEALAIAARHPVARFGAIEVRPFEG